jgi:hypothetical protein
LSKFKGIEFDARGTGKFRLQMTEGYMRFVIPVYGMAGFEDFFGEIYEKIIIPKPRWTHYQIPFDEFARRKDYQHNMKTSDTLDFTDEKKFDNMFDRSETHSTEIEFLPRGNPKGKKYIDFKGMRFYKNKKHEGQCQCILKLLYWLKSQHQQVMKSFNILLLNL